MEITISGVCERDMDLFLIEELSSDIELLGWLFNRCGLGQPVFDKTRILHSAVAGNGESDIEVHSTCEDAQRVILLIENKVGAAFQPRQAERYQIRAQNYRSNGTAENAVTLLFAPSVYIDGKGGNQGFDYSLSYEELAQKVALHEGEEPRKVYKRTLLQAAANKSRNGYAGVMDDNASRFWHRYWEICEGMEPSLEMKEPTGNPTGSTFLQFPSHRLPKNLSIWHKFDRGFVELNLKGWGSRVHELRTLTEGLLDSDMTVNQTSKSAVIRLQVPPLEVTRCPDSQSEELVIGIVAAGRMLRWLRTNERTLVGILSRPQVSST